MEAQAVRTVRKLGTQLICCTENQLRRAVVAGAYVGDLGAGSQGPATMRGTTGPNFNLSLSEDMFASLLCRSVETSPPRPET